ncbi:Crp/Fnr family transcriptional regulator [Paenibacillus pini]|uniref:N-ribosylNicotinamide CRP-like regulator n=1 Tax=Paenibacillus pini JCM 16418 TaxID=1236976 RepID=W7YPH6_9BACL|nr:cyclic nucleotide-binding domain-containing protein [Paenibacillus pini]GAF10352.1 N-ribosylNicotinamide CRP-like regulator [Paenibacillus pini JCM 16418]
MIEVKDRELLESYLIDYHIESIFNEPLLPLLKLYSCNQGEIICSQGEPSDMLYVLVKGKTKIYTTSVEGRTLILSFKTPLELIGDIEYVHGTDIINTVEAVSPVYMIGVHHRWLRKYGSEHAPLLQFLLKIITQKFYIKSNALSFNLMYPVEVRLASYLLSVSFDESDAQFKGQLRTTDLKDVANLIGTSYRHQNRIIGRFCADGLIERNKGCIVVKNREGLRAMASRNIYEIGDQSL